MEPACEDCSVCDRLERLDGCRMTIVRRFAQGPRRAFQAAGDALLAEWAVERLLAHHGCRFEREVPQPSGHTTDFLVERDGVSFHLHVKWLAAAAPVARLGVIPRVLRELERLERPIDVAVRWRPGAGCAAFRRLVQAVGPFLMAARVSEERVVRDAHGVTIGSVRVIGPRAQGGVRVVDARMVERRVSQSLRAERLLRKALAQFMPRAPNVILLVSADPLDADAIDNALHGTIVERWDRFPERGHRVAHGRGDDGFWSLGRASGSRIVAWLRAGDGPKRGRRSALWIRPGRALPGGLDELLRSLFDR